VVSGTARLLQTPCGDCGFLRARLPLGHRRPALLEGIAALEVVGVDAA
jgi:hypothetical protein